MTVSDTSIRVLLVEDSAILTKLLTGLIEAEAGTRVVGRADTVAAALQAIENSAPDVVVVDLRLREGSGFDVLRAIRERASARPHAIVLTNHSGDVYRNAAIEAGARHFFDKSTQIPLMLSTLRALARNRDAD